MKWILTKNTWLFDTTLACTIACIALAAGLRLESHAPLSVQVVADENVTLANDSDMILEVIRGVTNSLSAGDAVSILGMGDRVREVGAVTISRSSDVDLNSVLSQLQFTQGQSRIGLGLNTAASAVTSTPVEGSATVVVFITNGLATVSEAEHEKEMRARATGAEALVATGCPRILVGVVQKPESHWLLHVLGQRLQVSPILLRSGRSNDVQVALSQIRTTLKGVRRVEVAPGTGLRTVIWTIILLTILALLRSTRTLLTRCGKRDLQTPSVDDIHGETDETPLPPPARWTVTAQMKEHPGIVVDSYEFDLDDIEVNGGHIAIGTDPGSDVHLSGADDHESGDHHCFLTRQNGSLLFVVPTGQAAKIGGQEFTGPHTHRMLFATNSIGVGPYEVILRRERR